MVIVGLLDMIKVHYISLMFRPCYNEMCILVQSTLNKIHAIKTMKLVDKTVFRFDFSGLCVKLLSFIFDRPFNREPGVIRFTEFFIFLLFCRVYYVIESCPRSSYFFKDFDNLLHMHKFTDHIVSEGL